MSTGRWSLRRRLLVAIGGAALLGWCVSSFWLYSEAIAETDRGFDVALDHAAHAVLAFVANENRELRDAESSKGIDLAEIDHLHGEPIVYQVRGPGGGIAYRSPGAPAEPLARRDDRGFAFVRADGRGFRVDTLATEDGAATIHVAQPLEERDAVANAVALKLLAPGAALLAVLALTIGWTVRAAAEPLIRYSRDLDRLAPAQSKPVDSTRLPDELQPVARRDYQHRRSKSTCTRRAQQVESAAVRQAQIEHDRLIGHDRWLRSQPGAVRIRGGLDPIRRVAVLAQADQQRAAEHRIVLDQQQTHGVVRRCSAMNLQASISSGRPGRRFSHSRNGHCSISRGHAATRAPAQRLRAFNTVAIVASIS